MLGVLNLHRNTTLFFVTSPAESDTQELYKVFQLLSTTFSLLLTVANKNQRKVIKGNKTHYLRKGNFKQLALLA
jgi:hypothetical protein